MDGETTCPVEPLNNAEQSNQPQELRPSSNNNTPTKVPRRKGSVFSLAGSFFKSHGKNDELDHSGKLQDSPPTKVSWNPFMSLRLKESKKKSTSFVTARCKSSSPEKDDTSSTNPLSFVTNRIDLTGFDEIGKRKIMRRKSLQDLLGTVGTKLSRGRRQVVDEANSPACDDRHQEHRSPTFLSPVPVQLGRGKGLGSPNDHRIGLKFTGNGDLKLGAKGYKGPPFMVTPVRMAPTGNDVKSERNGEQTNDEVPALVECTEVSQTGWDVDAHKSPKGFILSSLHDSVKLSATSLPEKIRTEQLVSFLQDVSSQMQKHTAFSSGEPLAKRTLSAVSKAAYKPPSTLQKDSSFDPALCNSIPSTTDVSSKEIAKHIISTAAKISENYHLSQSQDRRFIDYSESDADNVSHYSWDPNQVEVWDVIDKDREFLTKTIPKPCLCPAAMPEISPVEAALDCHANEISLVVGESPESFSGSTHIELEAQKAEKNASSDSIRVFHPRNSFCGPFTSQDTSISDTPSNLHHNNIKYSTYCHFDQENMSLIPQPSREYLDTERPQHGEESLEGVRIQTQSHSAHKASTGPHTPDTECQEALSITVADSSLDRPCPPFVCAPGPSTSRIGSALLKGSNNQRKQMEITSETERDSVTAGMYLLSSSPSTDSMNPSKLTELTRSGPKHSTGHEINNTAPKNTKSRKTRADLVNELLDRHAPDNESSPDLRAKTAVQRAQKSRRGLDPVCEDEYDIAYVRTKSHNIDFATYQKWSRDKESSDCISLDNLEDIAEPESAREHLQRIPTTLSTQIDFSHPSNSNIASGVGKMTMAAALRTAFRLETSASQKVFNPDFRSEYMSPMCPVSMYRMSDDSRVQQDQTKDRISDARIKENFSGAENDELAYADGVGTKNTSANTITQNRDEAGAAVADTSRKPLALAASILEHEDDSTLPKGQGSPGFADVIKDKISTCPTVLETVSTIRELPEFRSQSLTSAETLSASPSPIPRLLTPPTMAKISPYSPMIPSPLSGQKRAQTPGKRALTPLATMHQPGDFEVQIPAPPPSEADTEESSDFGLELQRCALAREGDKENGSRRSKSFTLYGHQIHYTGLEDTM